jgi:hypothetical protein
MPYAYVAGYDAGHAGASDAKNPYALGLPTDNEALAALWDDGVRVARRAAPALLTEVPTSRSSDLHPRGNSASPATLRAAFCFPSDRELLRRT